MTDLRNTPGVNLRTFAVGEYFVGEDGMTYKVTMNTSDTFAYISVNA